ncbi:MAG: hypothetical protein M3Y41_17390, partial [Pseudomonadota bacterium]|nr:hypothetical protein [Pseudomonadota bacterium]
MIRAALPRVTPGLADVLDGAVAILSHCADFAAAAGCSPATVYLAGAQGNVRGALAELGHRWPHLAAGGTDDFDVHSHGSSEVIGTGGYPDTIRRCALTQGGVADVRALVQQRRVEGCVWMCPTGELEGLHVRGLVEATAEGYRFVEHSDVERAVAARHESDLARDIIASGLDLSNRATFAAALELTLLAGSWLHLATGSRWYSDPATARAV